MQDTTDWILHNILYLDPSDRERNSSDQLDDYETGQPKETREFIDRLVPCVLTLGGRRSDAFEIKAVLVPVPSIAICSTNGEQLKAINASRIVSSTKITPTKIDLVLHKEGDLNISIQAGFDFNTSEDCRIFTDNMKLLFQIDTENKMDRNVAVSGTNISSLDVRSGLPTLVLVGNGISGESVCVGVSHYFKGEILKVRLGDNPQRPTFKVTNTFVTKTIGAENSEWQDQPASIDLLEIPISVLLVGRFLKVEATMVSRPSPLKAIKGPILPSTNGVLQLLHTFSIGSRTIKLNMVTLDFLLLISRVPQLVPYYEEVSHVVAGSASIRIEIVTYCSHLVIKAIDVLNVPICFKWNECLFTLPEPVQNGKLAILLTRNLAFCCTLSFLE